MIIFIILYDKIIIKYDDILNLTLHHRIWCFIIQYNKNKCWTLYA